MTNQRLKALNEVKTYLEIHIGHTITVGFLEGKQSTHKVDALVIVNDALMVKVDGEPFATVYADAISKCSCMS